MLNKTPLQVNHVLIFDYKKFLFRGLGSPLPMPTERTQLVFISISDSS